MERRPGRSHRPVWGAIVALTAAMALVACSSGSSSSTPQSLPPANTSGGSASSCPFSGTTAATQGHGTATAVISSVTPSKSGCIDDVTAKFSAGPPSWTVGYASGPFVDAKTGQAVTVPGPVTLVVTLAGTTYPGLGATPATVKPTGLDYVTNVTVITGTGGSLEWIVSLPSQLPYATSMSTVPANLVLSIG
jgi:hypothetical protein